MVEGGVKVEKFGLDMIGNTNARVRDDELDMLALGHAHIDESVLCEFKGVGEKVEQDLLDAIGV